jgi:hypothetical protein
MLLVHSPLVACSAPTAGNLSPGGMIADEQKRKTDDRKQNKTQQYKHKRETHVKLRNTRHYEYISTQNKTKTKQIKLNKTKLLPTTRRTGVQNKKLYNN